MKKGLAKKIFAPFALLLVLAISACQFSTENSGSNDNSTGAGTSSPHSSSSLKDSEQNSASSENVESSELPSQSSTEKEDIVTDALSIHFLELGNKYTGDCTLIKVGNTEVLIDAGSRQSSATTIKNYVNQYCSDGVLEYVIATHADQDHIAGMVGTSTQAGYNGILYSYDVTTLIQFPLTGKSAVTEKGNATLYGKYLDAVEYAKGAGTAVYTALECWNNENGAQRSYTLGENVTMNILYQKYYEQTTSDENDYSVCMLLTQGENNYLFTGDLEKHGEASLVENNDLPKCVLFKGGHHGSPTSSTVTLLEKIDPDIVCVCCCCGSTEYTSNMENVFPAQEFVNRVAPYTDRVYVTTVVADNEQGFESMNGNIVLSSDGKEIAVNCSNNNTLFKDTDWFKKNRTLPQAWQS